MPESSVIMSVFNSEEYLRKAIESILGQTYKDFEFIIIDDGSTDNSKEIIDSFDDSRIQLIDNPRNLGLARSLNKGIREAEGKYIIRMDADDISLPKRFEKQIHFLRNNEEIDICGTWVETIGAKNIVWKYPTSFESIKCSLLFNSALAHPSAVFKKKIFDEGGLHYNEDLEVAQDYDLWVRASKKYRIRNFNEVLLRYRIHPKGIGRSRSSTQIDIADTIRKKQLEELGIEVSHEDLILHSKLSRYQIEETFSFLKKAEYWFELLLNKLSKSEFYQTNSGKKEINKRWWYLCNKCKDWRTMRAYYSSNLSTSYQSYFQKFKFTIECTYYSLNSN